MTAIAFKVGSPVISYNGDPEEKKAGARDFHHLNCKLFLVYVEVTAKTPSACEQLLTCKIPLASTAATTNNELFLYMVPQHIKSCMVSAVVLETDMDK